MSKKKEKKPKIVIPKKKEIKLPGEKKVILPGEKQLELPTEEEVEKHAGNSGIQVVEEGSLHVGLKAQPGELDRLKEEFERGDEPEKLPADTLFEMVETKPPSDKELMERFDQKIKRRRKL